jgi:hypothetical protein
VHGRSASERSALLSVDEQVALALQYADEEEREIPDAKPAETSAALEVDSDVQSLVVLLQTHAKEGFLELGINYVMRQRLRHGNSGLSTKARMKLAIARAEVLGLIGLRRTAVSELLHLRGASEDNSTASRSDYAASDFASVSSSSIERSTLTPTPIKPTGDAGLATTGKAIANGSDGARPPTVDVVTGMLANVSLALPGASHVTSGTLTPAGTPLAQTAVNPEREDADSDDDSDDEHAGPEPASAVTSEADIASLVAFCRSEHAKGNTQLGLTYVRMRLRPAGRQTKQWKLARLRATVAATVQRGLLVAQATPLGEWLLTPGTTPHVNVDPSALEAGVHLHVARVDAHHPRLTRLPCAADFDPLLVHLRGGAANRGKLKTARKYFFKKVAACPYGTRTTGFRQVLERAAELGLIVFEGTGKKCVIRLRA